MKHLGTLVALPVLTCGVVLAGSPQASAREIDPEDAYREVVVVHEPGPTIKVDDNITEGLQAGAAAIGGAGITMAALWAYRRRHPIQAH
jgi:hypothetical protein